MRRARGGRKAPAPQAAPAVTHLRARCQSFHQPPGGWGSVNPSQTQGEAGRG